MKQSPLRSALFLLLFVISRPLCAAAADLVQLQSSTICATLDPLFPRIVSYQVGDLLFAGQATPVSTVELNGKPADCKVQFKKTAANMAEYALSFPVEQVVMRLSVTVETNCVELRVVEIKEAGAFKVKTIFFPGNALLTFGTREANAAIAACLATHAGTYNAKYKETIASLAAIEPGARTGNYFFASVGKLAVGIADNNPVDAQRTAWQISESGGVKTCTAWCPAWLYREIDSEITELPYAKVFVTADRNGDGQATWQDAAIVYRANMPKPFGAEFVKDTVCENISMNFASMAQQPFLRVLDEVKKIYLATDGLGSEILIKGHCGDGHDSAHPDLGGDHLNSACGGLKDLTVLLGEAHKYNTRIGVHINVTEGYPEAHRFNPSIIKPGTKEGQVYQPSYKWLDQSYRIDKHADAASGQLYAALDQMRAALSRLDFVYVDTYWESGWPAWKIASKLASLGLEMHTEGSFALDPWTTWAHWRRGEDHNRPGTIQRFLWFSERDLLAGDPILRGGRSDNDTFMGWHNRYSFSNSIREIFAGHMPAKYLQHFELLRWTPGEQALFSGGVKVVNTKGQITVSENGRTVMTWSENLKNTRLFVPWDPIRAPKIYVWDETGAAGTWELPPSWKQRPEVFLYKLTPLGRTAETRIPVVQGAVSIQVEKAVPYVLYPAPAPAQELPEFGEGALVKDPGFDRHDFRVWKPSVPAAAAIEDDGFGKPHLVLSGSAACEVSQNIASLLPGHTYLVGAWIQVNGKRTTSINMEAGNKRFSNAVDETNVKNLGINDPRSGTDYQYVKLRFEMPAGADLAKLTLRTEAGSGETSAEFGDVRLVETDISPEASKHWFWEDFENLDLGGYGPFISCRAAQHSHLSETNHPYTTDTIRGQFSLKCRDVGLAVRTLPSALRFKPNTRYRMTCSTIGGGHLTTTSGGKTVLNLKFPSLPKDAVTRIEGSFTTGNDTESYLSLFHDADGSDYCVIDDLAIDELGPANDR